MPHPIQILLVEMSRVQDQFLETFQMALQLNISIGHGRVATFGVLLAQQLHWQGRLIGGTAGTGTCTNESVPGCVCMVCMRIARKQDLAGYMYACASPGNIPSTTRQRPQVFTLDTKSLGLGGFAAFLLTIVDGQGRKLISYLYVYIISINILAYPNPPPPKNAKTWSFLYPFNAHSNYHQPVLGCMQVPRQSAIVDHLPQSVAEI